MTPKQTKQLLGTIVTNLANVALACDAIRASGAVLTLDDMEYIRKLQATCEFNANHTEWHLFDEIVEIDDETG